MANFHWTKSELVFPSEYLFKNLREVIGVWGEVSNFWKGLLFTGLVRCTRHMSAFDICGLGVSSEVCLIKGIKCCGPLR